MLLFCAAQRASEAYSGWTTRLCAQFDRWSAEEKVTTAFSSTLTLPEHYAADDARATLALSAMKGAKPRALEGRLDVNLTLDGVRWLHVDPPVFVVDDLLSGELGCFVRLITWLAISNSPRFARGTSFVARKSVR